MSLRHRFQTLGRELRLRLSADPLAEAQRQIMGSLRDQQEGARGYSWFWSDRELETRWKVFEFEEHRRGRYKDAWGAYEGSSIVSAGLDAMGVDCTQKPFDIRCDDRVAREILLECFARTNYQASRAELLTRFLLTGDVFRVIDLNARPRRKRAVAEISGIRLLPEYQMFRLTNSQGFFENPERAFAQTPWLELEKKSRHGTKGVVIADQSGGRIYAGLLGSGSGIGYRVPRDREQSPVYFGVHEVVHSRLKPMMQRMATGYGCGGVLSSARSDYNRVQMAIQDLGIGRTLSSFARMVSEFNEDVDGKSVAEHRRLMENHQPSAAQGYTIHGGKMYLLDGKNHQLMRIDDIYLHIMLLGLTVYPMVMLGLGLENVTGEILDQIIRRHKAQIGHYNLLEEYQFIRPVGNLELLYHGKAGVRWDVVFPEVSIEDLNLKTKRDLSKISAGSLSRRTEYIESRQASEEDWEQEYAQIQKELRELGPIQRYQSPGESLEKGKQGVTTKDSSEQDIAE
ncbi:hypothetical protein KJZ99_00040 [bacterium]|nr:hypothetical protein [bacterium]